jgi:hypothetical protein
MKRWQAVLIALIVVLGVAVLAAYHLGVRLLQDKVVTALGPGSRLTELKVNWFSIELLGLAIDAPKDWPAAQTLEAERVTIIPELRTLFSQQVRIGSIVVEKPYLSMLRTSRQLILVPSLTQEKKSSGAGAPDKSSVRGVYISKIELKNGALELHDATVSRPPLRIDIVQLEGVIRDIAVPAAGQTRFDLAGIVKGANSHGSAKVSGWVGPGVRDSSSRVSLVALDLVRLQPYLVKRNEARVTRGTLDLNLTTEVRDNSLNGKGNVVLKDLEFAPSRGAFESFMGVPRNAVIAFLKDHNNAIDVDFTLAGDTRNPSFSLNENLSTRIASAVAGQLGVSIQNVAEGLGSLGQKGLEGAGSVVDGIGSAVKQLFGGSRK